ncbi:MAG: hypothetical protein JWQ38_3194 [Flavipsychrobacter sp.]|nr:hypothetical protein [Flavipsychrobacter sp.]
MKINKINPALQDFIGFIGNWEMELSNASFLPDTKTIIKGTAIFEWFEEGDFLILRQGTKKEVPWATWFIGRDKDAQNYTVLYFDDRQYSRVYEMSFENGIWKIWRNSPDFIQRFTGMVSEDKKMISGCWEKSTDGKTWSHDFDLKYVKNE